MHYRYSLVLLLVLITTGCQDRRADQLMGRWIGRPDTSIDQKSREAVRFQASGSTALAAASSMEKRGMREVDGQRTSEENQSEDLLSPTRVSDVTDWEQFDVQIAMEFASGQQVHMSLGDGSERKSGQWRIVEETPIGLIVEIETHLTEVPGKEETIHQDDAHSSQGELRRFELQLDYEEPMGRGRSCIGFRLVEVGADPRLGAIYFKREKSS